MVIVNRRILLWLTGGFADAIALFPFIIISDKRLLMHKTLINHEKIHLRQQIELFIIVFYIWYLAEFLFRLAQYRSFAIAYRNICFEREAYTCEDNLNYLQERKMMNFVRFL